MAKLRMEGESFSTVMSNCGSPISSWMSDLSMGSEADQSLHSFSQSQSQQGEALAEPEPNQSLSLGWDGPGGCENGRSLRRGSLEGEVVLSVNGANKVTATKDRRRKLPPSMAKTNIHIFARSGNLSPFKTTISVHPCATVRPMVLQEPTILSSPTKTPYLPMKDAGKYNAPLLASMSSEMSFEDPWLKRVAEEGRSRELVCEVKPEKRDMEHSKCQTGTAAGDQRSFCRDGKRSWTGMINQAVNLNIRPDQDTLHAVTTGQIFCNCCARNTCFTVLLPNKSAVKKKKKSSVSRVQFNSIQFSLFV